MRKLIVNGFGLGVLLLAVGAIGSGLLFSQTARRKTTPEEHYNRGIALYKKYECVKAIAEFDKAINQNPQNAKYYIARVACRTRESANTFANGPAEEVTKQIKNLKAIVDADLDRALEIDPKYPNAYFERAKAYSSFPLRSDAETENAALADFSKAIELDTNNSEFYFGRAEFHARLGDRDRAAGDFDVAVSLRPAKKDYRHARARNSGDVGNHKSAILDLSYVIKRYPKDYVARWFRARHYFADGQNEKALTDYTTYLRLNPEGELWMLPERAKVYRALGKNALADADERRAKSLQEKLDRELDELLNDPK